jgi:uncharacterized protein
MEAIVRDKIEKVILLASFLGFKDIVELILSTSKSGTCDATNENGFTPLMMATVANHHDIVDVLINGGCNLNLQDTEANSVLTMAAEYGRHHIVRALCEAEQGRQRGQGEVGKEKVNEAFLDMKSDGGLTALMRGAYKGHSNIVEILVEAGAQLDLQANDGMSAIALAAFQGHRGAVYVFIQHKANLDLQSNDGYTPLMCAAQNGHLMVVKALVDGGANVLMKEKRGRTALFLSASKGKLHVVKYLLKLKKTSEKGLESVPVQAEVGLELQDKSDMTPLLISIASGHTDVVRTLLQHGAALTAKWLGSALAMAKCNKHAEIVAMVQKEGRWRRRRPWLMFWSAFRKSAAGAESDSLSLQEEVLCFDWIGRKVASFL